MNNHKKIINDNLILIILIVIAVLCFLKYCVNCETNEAFKNKRVDFNKKEKFKSSIDKGVESIIYEGVTSNLKNIDYNLFKTKDDILLYHKLIVNNELHTPREAIIIDKGIDPELGHSLQSTELYKRFPINIILFPINITGQEYKYIYLAVFNDGGIYKKNTLEDNNWEGPLRNSYYYFIDDNDDINNKHIPMRNLAISNEGRLLGVGYDGNIYIKKTYKDNDLNLNLNDDNFGDLYKNAWVKYNFNDLDLIHIMLINKDDLNLPNQNDNIYYLGINKNGNINKYSYIKDTNDKTKYILKYITTIDRTLNNIYKISLDTNRHLLIITQNMELKRSEETFNEILTNSENIVFNLLDDNDKNPNILYDIIHSQNGQLYGIGSINNNIKLLKQSNINFLSPFSIINNETKNNNTLVIPKKDIVSYKSNYKVKETPRNKIKSLEESYNKEVNEDKTKFKTFCRAQSPNNYIDIDMLNKIEEFNNKIEKLECVKKNLIKLDDLSPIQEDDKCTEMN